MFQIRCAIDREHRGVCDLATAFQAYANPADSITDYLLLLDSNAFPTDLETLEDYVNTLEFQGILNDTTAEAFLAGIKQNM